MIRKVGSMYYLYTKDGKRILGRHKSHAAAKRQEVAIKIAKAKRKGKFNG